MVHNSEAVQATVSPHETSPSLAAIVASVDEDLGGFRAQTSPDGMMTIVFTDIVGSTEMLERLGEERWLELIQTHNQLIAEVVEEHEGSVVKTQGDGFMLAFSHASGALRCAAAMQQRMAEHDAAHPDAPLPIRIGLHTGNVFSLDHDFLGRAVVLAARITGQARAGEILVSSAVKQYTDRLGLWRYGHSIKLRLKGLASMERVFGLDWRAGQDPPDSADTIS